MSLVSMISLYACILLISLALVSWKSIRKWASRETPLEAGDGLTLKALVGNVPKNIPRRAIYPRQSAHPWKPKLVVTPKLEIVEIAPSVAAGDRATHASATHIQQAVEVKQIAVPLLTDNDLAKVNGTFSEEAAAALDDEAVPASEPKIQEVAMIDETSPSLPTDDIASQAGEPTVQEAAKVEEAAPAIGTVGRAVQASEPTVQEAATVEEIAPSVPADESVASSGGSAVQESVRKEIFSQSFHDPSAEEQPIAKTFLSFYGLSEQPFGVTPDPAYLYLNQAHQEAFAALSEGIRNLRGFMALVAEPGMGKTTLLNKLMEELRDSARVVFLFQTQCNSRELLRYILGELGVAHAGMDLVAMHRALNEFLFQGLLEGRRFVLVVDEAQNLQDSTLETIRLLSDFETTHAKLLQIVLAGQPQLADRLTRPHLSQLRQRIAVLANLEPLDATGTARYIEHRLGVAGSSEPLFTPDAVALIAEWSQGIPRNINNICCNALLQGYAQERKTIDTDIVQKVAGKLDLESLVPQRPEQPRPAMNPAPAATANNSRQLEGPGPVQQVEAKVRGSLTGKLTELARSRPWSKDEEFKLQLLLEREPSSNLPVADRYYSCSFYVSEEQATAFRLGQSIRIKFEQD